MDITLHRCRDVRVSRTEADLDNMIELTIEAETLLGNSSEVELTLFGLPERITDALKQALGGDVADSTLCDRCKEELSAAELSEKVS